MCFLICVHPCPSVAHLDGRGFGLQGGLGVDFLDGGDAGAVFYGVSIRGEDDFQARDYGEKVLRRSSQERDLGTSDRANGARQPQVL